MSGHRNTCEYNNGVIIFHFFFLPHLLNLEAKENQVRSTQELLRFENLNTYKSRSLLNLTLYFRFP